MRFIFVLPWVLSICSCYVFSAISEKASQAVSFEDGVQCLCELAELLSEGKGVDEKDVSGSVRGIIRVVMDNVPSIKYREGFFPIHQYHLDYSGPAAGFLLVPSIAVMIPRSRRSRLKGSKKPDGNGKLFLKKCKKILPHKKDPAWIKLKLIQKKAREASNSEQGLRCLQALIAFVKEDRFDCEIDPLVIQVRISSIINGLLEAYPQLHYLLQFSVSEIHIIHYSRIYAGFLQIYSFIMHFDMSTMQSEKIPQKTTDEFTSIFNMIACAESLYDLKESLAKGVFVGLIDVNLAICFSLYHKLQLELFWNVDPKTGSETLYNHLLESPHIDMVQFYCLGSIAGDIKPLFEFLPETVKLDLLKAISKNINKESPKRLVDILCYCLGNHPALFKALSKFEVSNFIKLGLSICPSNPRKAMKIVEAILNIPYLGIAMNADRFGLEDVHFDVLGEPLMLTLVQQPRFCIETTHENWPESINSVIRGKLMMSKIPRNARTSMEISPELLHDLGSYERIYYISELCYYTKPTISMFWAAIGLFHIPYCRDILRTIHFDTITDWFQWYERYVTALLIMREDIPNDIMSHHIFKSAIADQIGTFSHIQ